MSVSVSPDTAAVKARVYRSVLGRGGRMVRHHAPAAATVAAALAAGSLVVAGLERIVGFDNGSPAFLLAVVVVAVVSGTGPAIATAIGAFLAYDYLFIEPVFTFTVRDPAEWLNLLLLLTIGIVVGRLAGRERARAVAAVEGEREATAMFNISFTLASHRDPAIAMLPVAEIVRSEIRASRVWITLGEAVAADTSGGTSGRPMAPAVHVVLRRKPGDEPADWVRVHAPGRAGKSGQKPADISYRVAIVARDQAFGSIWAVRAREVGDPDPGETRVMAAAADQIGGAVERDRLQREANSAEILRRSELLKSALLDSVSHDLRTPLASIRAAAGMLADREVEWPAETRREMATSIDREAAWLNRLVTNLLDMSRVEAGKLRPNLGVFALGDLVSEALARSTTETGDRAVTVDVGADLPPVLVDEVLMGQVLANTLDNAAKYGGSGATIRIRATVTPEHRMLITVEDSGPGVAADALPRLFEKFYRVPRKGEGSRRGTGIGLSVVRGLVEAMDGQVTARRSELGGLAIDFDVPIAAPGPDEAIGP